MDEATKEKVAVTVHALAAVLVGYLSPLSPKILIVPAGIVLMVVLGLASRRLVKKELKWWAGNGAAMYLLVWIVAWTFFINW